MVRRSEPEALDQQLLEDAARLLLGDEFKRPLATLLGPHHPDGGREHLDFRLPFRWFAPRFDARGEQNRGWRPIPNWVWPVMSMLLSRRAQILASEGLAAKKLSVDIEVLLHEGPK